MKLLIRILAVLASAVLLAAFWHGAGAVIVQSPTAFDPANTNPDLTLSGGNLIATNNFSSSGYYSTRSLAAYTTGQLYNEFTYNSLGSCTVSCVGLMVVGIGNGYAASELGFDSFLGVGAFDNGGFYIDSTVTAVVSPTWTVGNTIGMAVDLNAHLIWLTEDGVHWNAGGSCTPANAACGTSFAGIACPCYAYAAENHGYPGTQLKANFGATAYAYTRPAGFVNWLGTGEPVQAARVQPLVTSFGVNTHINQGGVYSTSNIIADLSYLGINSVRDYPRTYFSQTANYNTLAAAGVKFNFATAGGNCNSDSVASTLASDWASFIASYPGALLTAEGLNEVNNFPSCYLQAATTNNTTASGNPTLHFAATLASLQAVHSGGYDAGMTIVDSTTGSAIPSNTVQSAAAATTVTMNANAAGSGVGSGDTITFEANAALTGGADVVANTAAAVAFQQSLYNDTHASVAGVGVINFTTCCATTGVIGSADFSNFHFYPIYGSQPLDQFASFYSGAYIPGIGPAQITETGYYTAGSTPPGSLIGTDGVDAATQARYLLMGLMDYWAGGITKTYIYEMVDEACDPGNSNAEDHYGLFDCSNNPKTAATSLANFHSILNDSGGTALTFTPGRLNYSVAGLPAPNPGSFTYGGWQLLFQKSNGRFEIVLWNETYSWQYNSGEVAPTLASVTITLGSTASTVNVYDPVIGSSPTNTYSNTSSVSISLGTDVQIVEVIP